MTDLRVPTAACVIAALLSSIVVAQSSVPLFFESGWENQVGLACGPADLLDASGSAGSEWGAYGGSNGCVVNTEKHDGSRALQVTHTPDGSINGPAFRIERFFGDRSEVYVRWWVKYSNNWVWGNNQHKVAILGPVGNAQNIYFNVQTDGVRGGPGYVVIAVIPGYDEFSDPTAVMTPGVWHLCELHIVAGTNGRIEAKFDGRLLNLRSRFGLSPNNVNTGPAIGYLKLDTTYNDYAYPTSLNRTMHSWYDSVAMSTVGWIHSGPASPTNLRISR